MTREAPKRPAKCPWTSRQPVRCLLPNLRKPALCGPPSAFEPWVSTCGVRADAPILNEWGEPGCATVATTHPEYAGLPVPEQPWYEYVYSGASFEGANLTSWMARGAAGDPSLTPEQVLAYLDNGTSPGGTWRPCDNASFELHGAQRIRLVGAHPDSWGVHSTVPVYLCWEQDHVNNRMVGVGETRVWRFVEVLQDQYMNFGGACEPCCMTFQSDLTLRPAVESEPDRYFFRVLRQGPYLPPFREFEAYGTIAVQLYVPGVYNNRDAMLAAWPSVRSSAHCVVVVDLPVISRTYWRYFAAHRIAGAMGNVWHRSKTRIGGLRQYTCQWIEAVEAFLAPAEETYFAASGFSAAESNSVGCANWYPLPAPPRTNGVWTATNLPLAMTVTL